MPLIVTDSLTVFILDPIIIAFDLTFLDPTPFMVASPTVLTIPLYDINCDVLSNALALTTIFSLSSGSLVFPFTLIVPCIC
uniref:Uncharacterized protein n=1 Tax=uncultured marine virus TaxID=186617 RepID=A0A0F7L6U5_9VIRU|nr:hypothetical protein [uncultured marine virus]